jgi:hypothetical protein
MRWPERSAVRSSLAAALLVLEGLLPPAAALAASPTPDAVGDPRSSGQGPGLVGDPLAAILIVVAIAFLALLATLVYVRATGGPGRRGAP